MSKIPDPRTLTLRGRIGAYRLHATHDPRETTAKAREAFLSRFLDEVDPERILPEGERLRRADYARKAYFTRLALASARARSKRPPLKKPHNESSSLAEGDSAEHPSSQPGNPQGTEQAQLGHHEPPPACASGRLLNARGSRDGA